MKVFNLRSTTAVVIANMIGSGVFTSLGYQLADIQSFYVIMLLWLVGAVASLFGALSYASLVQFFPRSGGEYHFLSKLYHPVVGFSAGFVSLFFGFAAPIALVSMALGEYLENFLSFDAKLLAAFVLISISLAHLASVRFSAKFQVYTTLLKVSLLLIFIILGFWYADGTVFSENIKLGDFKSELFSFPFAVGLAYVFFSYSGWNAATYFTDEIQSAKSTVFRALCIGVLVVGLLYMLLNAVFLYVAPVASLRLQLDVGHVAATYIFGESGGKIMSIFISLALISSISSMVVAGPRVAKVMGEDFSLLSFLSVENKKGVPVFAIVAQVSIALILLFTSKFDSVLIFTGFVLNLFNLLTVAGVFIAIHRFGFRLGLAYKIAASLFLFIYGWATVYLCFARPVESFSGLATILVGVVVYYVLVKFGTRNEHTPVE